MIARNWSLKYKCTHAAKKHLSQMVIRIQSIFGHRSIVFVIVYVTASFAVCISLQKTALYESK